MLRNVLVALLAENHRRQPAIRLLYILGPGVRHALQFEDFSARIEIFAQKALA